MTDQTNCLIAQLSKRGREALSLFPRRQSAGGCADCMSGSQTLYSELFPRDEAGRPRHVTLISTPCLPSSCSSYEKVTMAHDQVRREDFGAKQVNELYLRPNHRPEITELSGQAKEGMQVCLVPVLGLPPSPEAQILLSWQPHRAQLGPGIVRRLSPEEGTRPSPG